MSLQLEKHLDSGLVVKFDQKLPFGGIPSTDFALVIECPGGSSGAGIYRLLRETTSLVLGRLGLSMDLAGNGDFWGWVKIKQPADPDFVFRQIVEEFSGEEFQKRFRNLVPVHV